MGGKNNKPVHKSAGGGGGGGGVDEAAEKPFHSKEFEQAQLDQLLNAKERLTWDEFKEQQRKKGEMEGAESRADEEAQRLFRQELDEARNARLGGAAAAEDSSSKKKHSKKHKKEKHKKDKDKDKDKDKKHKKRSRHASSSSSDDSEEEEERRRKKKSKKEKKSSKDKADGPVSLRAFFAGSDDDSD